MRPPTVPEGTARLRISLTLNVTEAQASAMIDALADTLAEACMSPRFVIAGTDTDVGKTVFAAALAGALGAYYWKPIQCGLEDGGDIAA